MTLVSRIKEVAKSQHLSLIDVAIKAGIAENSIYGWTQKTPKADTLSKVADVLGVSTDYLLGRTDEMKPGTTETVKKADIDDSDLLLAFDGKDIDEEDKQAIIDLLMFRRYQKRNERK
ncbi:helix-turn-helix domain-containing protein [Leuconostoc citreum]|uniref:helix-turn-helix domain-containing protein n=1 Tax=Leuconostoc citreum TaxID=33964 RepID=UPI00200B9D63|nr:helix-turn-helix transcriptional regulator [Leuconostoc citreum]MCK8606145.1 helix-turn-helix domain-containing protein [Leuconostoc citreum]